MITSKEQTAKISSTHPSPRLVLLYATCTVNRRFLSPYNAEITYTPNLQKFANESYLFTNHRTEASLSGVAFASIFSGNQADKHHIFVHPTRLDDSVYTISEEFSENGYDVFTWNNHKMANANLNYCQGVPPQNIYKGFLKANDKKFQRILKRLQDDPSYKAMIITNFSVTHGPYNEQYVNTFCKEYPRECSIINEFPRNYFVTALHTYDKNRLALQYNFPATIERLQLSVLDIKNLSDSIDLLYKSNINHLDQLFGEIVNRVDAHGLKNESLIIFTADHGEKLYEESDLFHWSHGHNLKSDVLNVPLIIRAPNLGLKKRSSNFVSQSIDVFPTITGLSNLMIPNNVEIKGTDLSQIMQGKSSQIPLLSFSHSASIPPHYLKTPNSELGELLKYYPKSSVELTWTAVSTTDMVWKYKKLLDGKWHFSAFDINKDPMETHNVYDKTNKRHLDMAEELKHYKNKLVASSQKWDQSDLKHLKIPEKVKLYKLKSLGYIK